MSTTGQTWTFAEDEGGATSITYDGPENVVEVTTGPDCDGTTTSQTWFFWPSWDRPTEFAEFPLGTRHRNPAYRSSRVWDVYVDDPANEAHEHAVRELGHALIVGKYPLTAPESV